MREEAPEVTWAAVTCALCGQRTKFLRQTKGSKRIIQL